MAVVVKVKNHSAQVLAQMQENVSRAAQAVGTEAVGMVVEQMQQGYGKPIWQTGNLQRDVNWLAADESTIQVGNAMEYAPHVHEGTRKMNGRPYIVDALQDAKNQKRLQDTYKAYLKEGFK